MLAAYATWHGGMDREEGGVSVRANFVALARRKTPAAAMARAALVPPFLPEPLLYLWDLGRAFLRGVSIVAMVGPRATWIDVDAFDRARRLRLAAWEMDALLAISSAYFSAARGA